MSWEQISNLPFSPGLLGGFVGSLSGARRRPFRYYRFRFPGATFQAELEQEGPVRRRRNPAGDNLVPVCRRVRGRVRGHRPRGLGSLRADWSKLIYFALSFMNAAKALALAKTTGKKMLKASTQALLKADEEDEDGDKVGGSKNA